MARQAESNASQQEGSSDPSVDPIYSVSAEDWEWLNGYMNDVRSQDQPLVLSEETQEEWVRAILICRRRMAACIMRLMAFADPASQDVERVRQMTRRVAVSTQADLNENGAILTDDMTRSATEILRQFRHTPEVIVSVRAFGESLDTHVALIRRMAPTVLETPPRSPEEPEAPPRSPEEPEASPRSTEDDSSVVLPDDESSDDLVEAGLEHNHESLDDMAERILEQASGARERLSRLPHASIVELERAFTTARDQLAENVQMIESIAGPQSRVAAHVRTMLNSTEILLTGGPFAPHVPAPFSPEEELGDGDDAQEVLEILDVVGTQIQEHLRVVNRIIGEIPAPPFVDPPADAEPMPGVEPGSGGPLEHYISTVDRVRLNRLIASQWTTLIDFIEVLVTREGLSPELVVELSLLSRHIREHTSAERADYTISARGVGIIDRAIRELGPTPELRAAVISARVRATGITVRIQQIVATIPESSRQIIDLLRHILSDLIPPDTPGEEAEAPRVEAPEAATIGAPRVDRQEAIATLTYGAHSTPVEITPNEATIRALERAAECPLCMGMWETTGDHRVISLACGHLFGKSCITHHIRRNPGARCPLCQVVISRADIRVVYPPLVFAARGPTLPAPAPAQSRADVVRALRASIVELDRVCILRDRAYLIHSGLLGEVANNRGDRSRFAQRVRDSWDQCLDTQIECDIAKNKRDALLGNLV